MKNSLEIWNESFMGIKIAACLASGRPALINCAINPGIGTESGHISNLNPHSEVHAPAHEPAHH